MAQKLRCSCFLSIISYSYNVTIVISYYCNLVTFQTITPRYKLLVTKQVTSYFTSYFKSTQLRNLVTKVTSYPQLWHWTISMSEPPCVQSVCRAGSIPRYVMVHTYVQVQIFSQVNLWKHTKARKFSCK